MSRRVVALLAALAVAGALGACGDDDEREGGDAAGTGAGTATAEEHAPEVTGDPVASVDMSLKDFELDPAEPEVAEVGVIEFKLSNDGQAPHNLEVETPQGEFELEEDLEAGQSGTLRAQIEEPGEYVLYCPVGNHREMGMEGTLTVSGGGSGGGTGTDDDTTESGDAGAGGAGY